MIKISHGAKGKPEYIPFCGSRDEALMHEKEIRGLTDTSDPGFADHLPEFRLMYANRSSPRSVESLGYSFQHLQAFLGHCKLRHLTPMLIEQYKQHRLAAGVKKRTVNVELSALSAYITWVNEAKGCKFHKPKLFTRKETKPPLPQVLTVGEIVVIMEHLDGDMRLIVELMALAGLRRNEVLNLTAADVDVRAGVIRIHGKGGRYRMAPLGEGTWKKINELCRWRPDGPLFPSPQDMTRPRKDIRKAIQQAARAAGNTKHVTPHLFRHSFGAALVNNGADIRIIQELLGHSELTTTQLYTQVAGNVKRAAVAGLAATVAKEQSHK